MAFKRTYNRVFVKISDSGPGIDKEIFLDYLKNSLRALRQGLVLDSIFVKIL